MSRRGVPGLRLLAGLMTLLFGLAAAAQWNDPDPLRWVAFYLLAGATSLGAALGRGWRLLERLTAGIAAAVAIALAPALTGARREAFASLRMERPDDELARELAGAAIVLVWSAGLVIRRQRLRASASRD